ncbi:MAG: histidine kinase dimerization/phosphoacceptor domain-containing protein [Tetrasphaera sp.]|nr:histidine kinase dimerization/phosphoacceptor domain-containing protein [Tetrasphaera sp.]
MEQGQVPWWGVALTVIVAIAVAGRTLTDGRGALRGLIGSPWRSGVARSAVGFWMLITVTGLAWGTMGIPGSPAASHRGHAPLRRNGNHIGMGARPRERRHHHGRGLRPAVRGADHPCRTGTGATRPGPRSHYRSTSTGRGRGSRGRPGGAFAREIHDSVSHAVGLIAMQAGAAEVSADRDPESARRARGGRERSDRGSGRSRPSPPRVPRSRPNTTGCGGARRPDPGQRNVSHPIRPGSVCPQGI